MVMIEKTCKIDIENIDYIVLECGECGSEIRATQNQTNFPPVCPVCQFQYSAYAVNALKTFLEQIRFLKRENSKSKVYAVTKEENETRN